MVRQKTIEKYIEIKKMLKSGSTIRQIKTTLKCSEGTINDAKNYVPNVPNQLRTSNPNPKKIVVDELEEWLSVPNKKGTIKDKKGTVNLTIPVYLNEILLSYGKQYGRFEDASSDYKYGERMRRMKLVEEDLTRKYGMDFNYVLQRQMDRELKLVNKEIREANGGH